MADDSKDDGASVTSKSTKREMTLENLISLVATEGGTVKNRARSSSFVGFPHAAVPKMKSHSASAEQFAANVEALVDEIERIFVDIEDQAFERNPGGSLARHHVTVYIGMTGVGKRNGCKAINEEDPRTMTLGSEPAKSRWNSHYGDKRCPVVLKCFTHKDVSKTLFSAMGLSQREVASAYERAVHKECRRRLMKHQIEGVNESGGADGISRAGAIVYAAFALRSNGESTPKLTRIRAVCVSSSNGSSFTKFSILYGKERLDVIPGRDGLPRCHLKGMGLDNDNFKAARSGVRHWLLEQWVPRVMDPRNRGLDKYTYNFARQVRWHLESMTDKGVADLVELFRK